MIALTTRQSAILRAALEARVGADLSVTEQRELGEALAGHLELAAAWGRRTLADEVEADSQLQRACADLRVELAAILAACERADGRIAMSTGWTATTAVEQICGYLAKERRRDVQQRADIIRLERERDEARARTAELERELAVLRPPAKPARVPLRSGDLSEVEFWELVTDAPESEAPPTKT